MNSARGERGRGRGTSNARVFEIVAWTGFGEKKKKREKTGFAALRFPEYSKRSVLLKTRSKRRRFVK